MYIFNRRSTIDGVVYNYGDSADHLPKHLIQRFLIARLIRKEAPIAGKEAPIAGKEAPIAVITREDKFYNVSLNGVRLNPEPFKTKKAVEQFCKDNSLNYEYTL
ncbi:hypothetical protein vBPmiSPMCJR_040 [Proteus phage vB_PmiS_PM-CJR]|nr:hypothetical protein vBPmiSPMCJR_040 [Proteus phage vB_PmiS_PM-CJR]